MIRVVFIILVILGVILGVFLTTQKVTTFFSQAATPGNFPPYVIISNLSDTSFTVSWFTPEEPLDQSLYWSADSSLSNKAYDDRDDINSKPRYTHHVTLSGLTPNTEYSLKIAENPDSPIFKQKTLPKLSNNPPSSQDFSGSTSSEVNSTVREGIVYLKAENGQLLSSTVNVYGLWRIATEGSRTKDFSKYYQVQPTDLIEVYIQSAYDGQGFMSFFAYAYDRNKNTNLLLNKKRVPFFGLRLGGLEVKKLKEPSGGTPKPKEIKEKGFFENFWVTLGGLFR
ncbi:fibronectin type III domain-containing protein [Candidatus Daviesbacteria bacterium]|nr:fibronectin type III domain-containing protein [Candidatus Daviesbacteria bacterium]